MSIVRGASFEEHRSTRQGDRFFNAGRPINRSENGRDFHVLQTSAPPDKETEVVKGSDFTFKCDRLGGTIGAGTVVASLASRCLVAGRATLYEPPGPTRFIAVPSAR